MRIPIPTGEATDGQILVASDGFFQPQTSLFGGITVVRSGFSTASTTLVDVTGLAYSGAIGGRTYEIEATLFCQSDTSAGANFLLAYTGTIVNSACDCLIIGTTTTGTNGVIVSSLVNGGASGPFGTTASSDFTLKIFAMIRTSTGGTIKIQAKKNTSGNLFVMNSRLTVYPM